MRRYIIDRIEEDFAVCQDEEKKMINLELRRLPNKCKEGDCIVEDEAGNIYVDIRKTKSREKRAQELLDKLIK